MPFDALQARATAQAPVADRAVAWWLLGVAGMVWFMVALGGLTRLTGSGLSIMEWAPLSGTLPPFSEAEWRRLYDLYRSIPQYALVNQGMTLDGFREIFWLEWAHRVWGRLIGLAYGLPLLWFALRRRIPAGYGPRLVGLLLLGGLQGAIGWFMVASGFEAERTAVAPVRLVLHLGCAFALYAALLWTALGLLGAPDHAGAHARGIRRGVAVATVLLALTMLAGGFVAGLRAGLDYNTWPLMDGRLVPEGYAALDPFWRNAVANVAAVQFNHRLLASVAGLAAIAAAVSAWVRLPAGARAARRACAALGLVVLAQYGLGVATLLAHVPVWLGTLHQAVAVGVLTAALVALHCLREPAGPGFGRPGPTPA